MELFGKFVPLGNHISIGGVNANIFLGVPRRFRKVIIDIGIMGTDSAHCRSYDACVLRIERHQCPLPTPIETKIWSKLREGKKWTAMIP